MTSSLDKIAELELENERLKKLCRWQFLTLGFYATDYNYNKESTVYHPITGEGGIGIMVDKGRDAKQAQEVAKQLGFTSEEITSWSGTDIKR